MRAVQCTSVDPPAAAAEASFDADRFQEIIFNSMKIEWQEDYDWQDDGYWHDGQWYDDQWHDQDWQADGWDDGSWDQTYDEYEHQLEQPSNFDGSHQA